MEEMKGELRKNRSISEYLVPNRCGSEGSGGPSIDLTGKKLHAVAFLAKYLRDNQDVQVLNLSGNDIGNAGAEEIAELLRDPDCNLKELNLANNRIGASGLNSICSALCSNSSVMKLNIKNNKIEHSELKMLLALLYRNQTIMEIIYSEADPEKERNKQKEKEKSPSRCPLVACYRSFLHDKHESFRFKYDTVALNKVEEESMDVLTKVLYVNALIFYSIIFICPPMFANACGFGIDNASHYVYTVYSIISFVAEMCLVLKIQRSIGDA